MGVCSWVCVWSLDRTAEDSGIRKVGSMDWKKSLKFWNKSKGAYQSGSPSVGGSSTEKGCVCTGADMLVGQERNIVRVSPVPVPDSYPKDGHESFGIYPVEYTATPEVLDPSIPDMSTKPEEEELGYEFAYCCPSHHVNEPFEKISVAEYDQRIPCQTCGEVSKPAVVHTFAVPVWKQYYKPLKPERTSDSWAWCVRTWVSGTTKWGGYLPYKCRCEFVRFLGKGRKPASAKHEEEDPE